MKKTVVLVLALLMVFSLCACGHQHTWIEASCTEPKTCSECGETEGEALGHDADEWSVTKEASLVKEGEESRVCARCGEVLETRTLEKKSTAFRNGSFGFSAEDFVEFFLSETSLSISIDKCDDTLVKVGTNAYSISKDDSVLCYLSFQETESGEVKDIVFQAGSFDGIIFAANTYNFFCERSANEDSQVIFLSLIDTREYRNNGLKMTMDVIDHDMLVTLTGE